MNKNVKKFRIIKYKNIKPILRVKNLSKSFGSRQIIQNLSLSINPGSINGLLGPNGSGKTTLFNLLLGILKVDQGEIYAKGDTKIKSMPIHERANRFKIGYIPQNESVFRGLTCQDNLKAIAEISIKNKRERNEVVERLLEEFSLTDVRNTIANSLSGGQKKKLVIARALINKPEILLMDEIFSAIDPITIDVIKNIIVELQTNRNLSILITDHAFNNVLEVADKIFIISDGQIISSGKPQDIIRDASARKVYFGNTY
tara:strand:- start:528 stop:1301 length:774 start_codon:yes stop_codon:yes gene_type:complete